MKTPYTLENGVIVVNAGESHVTVIADNGIVLRVNLHDDRIIIERLDGPKTDNILMMPV